MRLDFHLRFLFHGFECTCIVLVSINLNILLSLLVVNPFWKIVIFKLFICIRRI